MSIHIGNYNFEGPFSHTSALHSLSGVYVILGRSGNSNWNVVDVGESAQVRDRVENHDRRPCWQRHGHAELAAAAFYTDERQRRLIEQSLRLSYRPPCGHR